MLKKSIIVLAGFLIFLIGCIIFAFLGKVEKKERIELDIEYVTSQFELNLFDEKIDNTINLYGNAKYIGNDTLENDISITMDVACIYTYTDANDEYTDIVENKIILKLSNSFYTGKASFRLKQNTIEGYSCTFVVRDVKGTYLK